MADQGSAGLYPIVSRNMAREAFAKALRLHVGYRGAVRRFTMAQLSEGSGVPARVIESAMEEPDSPEYRNPPLCAVLSLSAFLGERFEREWHRLAGISSTVAEDTTSDRQKECSILKAAVALSAALENNSLEDEEIRANRGTLESARAAIDALLDRATPKPVRTVGEGR